MGFFRRVRNILSSNLNELLERCENPELLLGQAIRDMEQALRSALAAAARVVAHEHLLEKQRVAAECDIAACRRQAEAAVRAGNDDDARPALRRQHDLQGEAASLAEQCAESAAASRKLRRQIESLRQRLAAARRQRDLLIARQRAAEARRQLLGALGDWPVDFDGPTEFDRMARKIQQSEAEADALTLLSGPAWIDKDSTAETEAAAWVEHELHALKNRS